LNHALLSSSQQLPQAKGHKSAASSSSAQNATFSGRFILNTLVQVYLFLKPNDSSESLSPQLSYGKVGDPVVVPVGDPVGDSVGASVHSSQVTGHNVLALDFSRQIVVTSAEAAKVVQVYEVPS